MISTKRKLTLALFGVGLVLGMTGCGQKEDDPSTKPPMPPPGGAKATAPDANTTTPQEKK